MSKWIYCLTTVVKPYAVLCLWSRGFCSVANVINGSRLTWGQTSVPQECAHASSPFLQWWACVTQVSQSAARGETNPLCNMLATNKMLRTLTFPADGEGLGAVGSWISRHLQRGRTQAAQRWPRSAISSLWPPAAANRMCFCAEKVAAQLEGRALPRLRSHQGCSS